MFRIMKRVWTGMRMNFVLRLVEGGIEKMEMKVIPKYRRKIRKKELKLEYLNETKVERETDLKRYRALKDVIKK